MNQILRKQNEPDFIRLLKAQRIAYKQCKRMQIFDVLSLLIAIAFPLLTLVFPKLQNGLNASGVLWTVAYLFTEYYRRRKTTEGANIQEQFDTQLYEIAWNRILCKDKVNADKIHQLAIKYTKDDLSNWYSTKIEESLPREIAIIICQRINFSWEISQRRKYVNLLILLTGVYYLIYIAIALFLNAGFFDLLVFISPSISFLIYGVMNIIALKSHVASKNETIKLIDDEIDSYRTYQLKPTNVTLRSIQDVIFYERTIPEKIPDWFYKINKSKNENIIDDIVLTIQKNL